MANVDVWVVAVSAGIAAASAIASAAAAVGSLRAAKSVAQQVALQRETMRIDAERWEAIHPPVSFRLERVSGQRCRLRNTGWATAREVTVEGARRPAHIDTLMPAEALDVDLPPGSWQDPEVSSLLVAHAGSETPVTVAVPAKPAAVPPKP